jgi:hypothetical protein
MALFTVLDISAGTEATGGSTAIQRQWGATGETDLSGHREWARKVSYLIRVPSCNCSRDGRGALSKGDLG